MSWYKRTPRLKEPPKKVPQRRTSPSTEKQLKEASAKQKQHNDGENPS